MGRRIITESDVESRARKPRSWRLASLGLVAVGGVGTVVYLLSLFFESDGGTIPPTTETTTTPTGTTGTQVAETTTGLPAEETTMAPKPPGLGAGVDVSNIILGATLAISVLLMAYIVYSRASSERAIRPEPAERRDESVPPESVPTLDVDDRSERILKTIPAEIITGWILVQGVIESSSVEPAWYLAIFVVGLVATPLHMLQKTQEPWSGPLRYDAVRLSQVSLATISFIVWVYSLGGPFEILNVYNPGIAGLVLAVYTWWLIPLLQPA